MKANTKFKIKQGFKRILPHLNIIMVVVLVTLLIIDICNPFMEFINNDITKGFIWFTCALSLTNAIVFLVEERKNAK